MRLTLLALALISTYVGADPVSVQGVGRTFDQARHSGFRQAIEQSVGSVVVGEQEQRNGTLVRDFAGNYSAGVVDKYEVLDSYQDDQGIWHVDMLVEVSNSKIANRMLAKPGKDILVNGDQLEAQMSSRLEERARGDMLLGTVLGNYPQQAYVINSGQTEFKISNLRQPYVEIPYRITMNKDWVLAFDEALRTVSTGQTSCNTATMVLSQAVAHERAGAGTKKLVGKLCGNEPDIRVFYKTAFIPQSNSYYLPDLETLQRINSELKSEQGQQHIGLAIDLLDASGNLLDHRCARINNELFINYTKPKGAYNLHDQQALSRPNIMGQNNVYGTLRVHIKTAEQFSDLAKIKLSVQQTCN